MKTDMCSAFIVLGLLGMGCAQTEKGLGDSGPEAAPVLYVVSMMHAEESISFHENEAVYERFASALEQQRELFAAHGLPRRGLGPRARGGGGGDAPQSRQLRRYHRG